MARDMTQGSPLKQLILFSGPMLVGGIFQQLYNMVDTMVVGRFVGEKALAAVGATGSLNFLIVSLLIGLSSGLSIIFGQYFGAKDYAGIRRAFANAIYLTVGITVLVSAAGIIFARPLLQLLNTPEDILDLAWLYLVINLAGTIGIAVYNGAVGILRAFGDSFMPLIFLIVASTLNALLDLVFVLGFGMGVDGAAYATILSQALSAVITVIYMMRKMRFLRMPLKELRPSKDMTLLSLRLTIPAALQNGTVAAGGMFLQRFINEYGSTVVAAYSAAQRVDQIAIQFTMTLGAAFGTYTSQNVGAGNYDRVNKGLKQALFLNVAISAFVTALILVFGKAFLGLFCKPGETEVIRIGYEYLQIVSPFFIFVGGVFIFRNMFQGAGDVLFPFVMSAAELVARIVIAAMLTGTLGYIGVFWGTPAAWILGSGIGVIYFFRGTWRTKSIVKDAPQEG
ncbi:MATE family efflux transporter [Oscillospiraceae bacterium OttesenSCG-928-F05]|nr:MATE family efflux transporter [Oscillospiraceae bacterium OttesenSCG-928-F05]